jgi:hypothetical protein
MSNPWKGIKLRKTGLNEERLTSEQKYIDRLEERQAEMANNLEADKDKIAVYNDRQASLASDAMAGQQERLGGKRRTRRARRTRRNKKHRKTRKSRHRHRK